MKLNTIDLQKLQVNSNNRITFSITESCPLKCKHCVISSIDPLDNEKTLSVYQAYEYAKQIKYLKNKGIDLISFTGGEPFIAPIQLKTLSDACAKNSIKSSVLTSCYWANSEENATKIVKAFSNISYWNLSTDIYHEEFVKRDNIINAAEAILKQNKSLKIRIATTLPFNEEYQELYNDLKNKLPGVSIATQKIIKLGRGASIDTNLESSYSSSSPCTSTGMAVRSDGTLSPCCANLFVERENYFFRTNVNEVGLKRAHDIWINDLLLQLIRAIGFSPILMWIKELFPNHEIFDKEYYNSCDLCSAIWKDQVIAENLRKKANEDQNIKKIRILSKNFLGLNY